MPDRLERQVAARQAQPRTAVLGSGMFLDRADAVLASAAAELRGRAWRLLHLGTWRGSDALATEPGCRHLRQAGGRTGPHAVAYGAAVFAELLRRMPMSFGAMQDGLGEPGSIDSILAGLEPALVVHPAIAMVPFSLPFQESADQQQFVS